MLNALSGQPKAFPATISHWSGARFDFSRWPKRGFDIRWVKVHSGSISVWYWISNGKCFPAGLFLQPPLCYGHFWVGKRYWVGLKNVHCKVSDEPAHPPLSRDGHTNIKFINDQSGNDFFARYNNFKNNITELFGFQKCLVQVLVLVWSVFSRFSFDARLFTFNRFNYQLVDPIHLDVHVYAYEKRFYTRSNMYRPV